MPSSKVSMQSRSRWFGSCMPEKEWRLYMVRWTVTETHFSVWLKKSGGCIWWDEQWQRHISRYDWKRVEAVYGEMNSDREHISRYDWKRVEAVYGEMNSDRDTFLGMIEVDIDRIKSSDQRYGVDIKVDGKVVLYRVDTGADVIVLSVDSNVNCSNKLHCSNCVVQIQNLSIVSNISLKS